MGPDRDAAESPQTIHITTYGRRSGRPRRIEIWWFHVDGRHIITGTPGKRDWYANIKADPRLIVHVDGQDIAATASIVEDRAFRTRVFTRPQTGWYSTQAELDHLVATAPMIEIHLASGPRP